jgi:hypothetical protein
MVGCRLVTVLYVVVVVVVVVVVDLERFLRAACGT